MAYYCSMSSHYYVDYFSGISYSEVIQSQIISCNHLTFSGLLSSLRRTSWVLNVPIGPFISMILRSLDWVMAITIDLQELDWAMEITMAPLLFTIIRLLFSQLLSRKPANHHMTSWRSSKFLAEMVNRLVTEENTK